MIYTGLGIVIFGLALLCFSLHRRRQEALLQSDDLRKQIARIVNSQSELREKNHQLRSFIMSIPDVLYFKDVNGQILLANKSFVDSLPEWEPFGKRDFFTPSAHLELLEISEPVDLEVLTTGKPRHIEQFIETGTIHRALYDTVKTPTINENGEVVGMVSSSRNVTEQRELEFRLHQSQKMESLGLLASGIAHDFNNILMAIYGYGALLEGQIDHQTKSFAHLERLLSSARRASDLVSQILTFSRQGDRERKPLKLELIVRECLQLIRAAIPTTIDIVEEVDRESGYMLGDITEIHQILLNLCVNASHAMERDGGTLTVCVRSVERDPKEEAFTADGVWKEKCLRLSVEDTGQGMDNETLSRIFDPFFTTKEIGKGTGMGLSVVHGIVVACGGTIEVNSKPGEGTEFDLFFPEVEGMTSESEGGEEELLSGEGHILLVDDQKTLVEVTSELLGRLGYRVTATTSASEALDLFKSDPSDFDLVITDLTMPKMGGDALAKEILAVRSDIPIILTTGLNQRDCLDIGRVIGVREIIQKPPHPHHLAQTIHTLLKKTD